MASDRKPGSPVRTGFGYEYIIKRIGRDGIVGKIPLGKLAVIDIEGYFARLRLSGVKENTIKKDRQLLHAALKKAKKDRLLITDPAEDIDLEKIRKYKAATYAPEQIIEMLDAFSEEEIYIPTLLAVFTGLRRGEVLGLRWADVDLEHGLLNITARHCMSKTARSKRVFPNLRHPRARLLSPHP